MSVFIDTSALVALIDADESNHARAAAAWREFLETDALLVTTNYVLVETTALVQHRLGMAAVRALTNDILPLIDVAWVTEEQHATGISMLLGSNRRGLSLVDCVSFEVMRQRDLAEAFAFDRHFAERGITVRPLRAR